MIIPVPRKKEINAMRIVAIVFIAVVLLIGCVHLNINRNLNALKRVEIGDDQAAVLDTMGPPDIRTEINARRLVMYYQTQAAKSTADPVTPDICTPIAFEDGRVVGVGDDLVQTWIREEQERVRRAEDAERKRREAQQAAEAKREAEAVRQQKIAALEKKVKPIPAHKAALNLELYRQLLALDPGNARYQKKVAFYEERLARQQKANKARAERTAKLKQRQAWDQARDDRNKSLRQYTGNGIAEMAVHDMGPGSLYVWVKNVSRQIITTHPDHFTLLDSHNKPTQCDVSSSLDSVLEPGSISHGKIEYSEAVIPSELVFRNRESGRITKSFQ
jgi:hypothetical protein